jgi:hypothetical protein
MASELLTLFQRLQTVDENTHAPDEQAANARRIHRVEIALSALVEILALVPSQRHALLKLVEQNCSSLDGDAD